jgi:hypothetical protein
MPRPLASIAAIVRVADLCAADPFPVIRGNVGAPGHETARRQRGFGRRRRQEAGNPKKRCDLISAAKSGGNGIDAFIDLCSGFHFAHLVKGEGMTKAMRAHRMALGSDLPGFSGERLRHLANHEERCFHALRRKNCGTRSV